MSLSLIACFLLPLTAFALPRPQPLASLSPSIIPSRCEDGSSPGNHDPLPQNGCQAELDNIRRQPTFEVAFEQANTPIRVHFDNEPPSDCSIYVFSTQADAHTETLDTNLIGQAVQSIIEKCSSSNLGGQTPLTGTIGIKVTNPSNLSPSPAPGSSAATQSPPPENANANQIAGALSGPTTPNYKREAAAPLPPKNANQQDGALSNPTPAIYARREKPVRPFPPPYGAIVPAHGAPALDTPPQPSETVPVDVNLVAGAVSEPLLPDYRKRDGTKGTVVPGQVAPPGNVPPRPVGAAGTVGVIPPADDAGGLGEVGVGDGAVAAGGGAPAGVNQLAGALVGATLPDY